MVSGGASKTVQKRGIMDRHLGVNPFHSFGIRPGRGSDQQLGSRRAVGIFPKPEIERSRHTLWAVVLKSPDPWMTEIGVFHSLKWAK